MLFDNQIDSVDRAMRNIYMNGYYHTAYEIQKGVGIAWNFATLDDKKISKVIHKPWAADGEDFSSRIWTNKTKLVNELNTTLTQNIILGRDPQKAIDEIARKMKVSKTNAGRLVMTEEAFFSSAAQKDCFKELDVEQYEIVATLDSHTSDICQNMDGQHFNMSQWEVGVTAPPFHVNCRTTTVPYFDDEFDLVGERAARDEEGKTYYVPADMDYSSWHKEFVENLSKGDKIGFIQMSQIKDEKIRKANEEFIQALNKSKPTPISNKMILYNEATEYQLNENMEPAFSYSSELDVIQYNPSSSNYEFYNMNFVQAHELSHRMDVLEYHSWENEKFVQAIKDTHKKVYDNIDKITEWFSEGGKYDEDVAFSDIFSALSEGSINELLCGGHEVDYWKADNKNVCMEIFANIASIDVLEFGSKKEFDGILKELYMAYKEIVG